MLQDLIKRTLPNWSSDIRLKIFFRHELIIGDSSKTKFTVCQKLSQRTADSELTKMIRSVLFSSIGIKNNIID